MMREEDFQNGFRFSRRTFLGALGLASLRLEVR